MAVTQPNLTIELTENTGCTGLSVADTTDDYGVDNNPAVNDVTSVTVSVEFGSLEASIVYVFTVANAVITDCALSVEGGTPENIFSNLTSTVWPFTTTTPFDLTADYGVTLPTFADDIFTVNYEISGTAGLDEFTYTTTKGKAVLCNSRCCLDKLWIAIDPTCSCSNDAMSEAMLGESLYNKAYWSAIYLDISGALEAMASLNRLCDSNCGGCGC